MVRRNSSSGTKCSARWWASGSSVTRVKAGDYAVFTVRRGCGECASCLMNRADMCQTGKYRERGIRGLDGYQTEYVVDQEQYVVQVPAELEPVGVLMEPLSVVEKAIDEALRVQTVRCPDAATTPDWFHGRRCLVAGLGPVGLLAAMVLRLRGGEVYGLDVVDSKHRPPEMAGQHRRALYRRPQVPADQVEKKIGGMDFILDASGIAALEFNLAGCAGAERDVCAHRHPGRRPAAANFRSRIDPAVGAWTIRSCWAA